MTKAPLKNTTLRRRLKTRFLHRATPVSRADLDGVTKSTVDRPAFTSERVRLIAFLIRELRMALEASFKRPPAHSFGRTGRLTIVLIAITVWTRPEVFDYFVAALSGVLRG
jgi:hypothetical protein